METSLINRRRENGRSARMPRCIIGAATASVLIWLCALGTCHPTPAPAQGTAALGAGASAEQPSGNRAPAPDRPGESPDRPDASPAQPDTPPNRHGASPDGASTKPGPSATDDAAENEPGADGNASDQTASSEAETDSGSASGQNGNDAPGTERKDASAAEAVDDATKDPSVNDNGGAGSGEPGTPDEPGNTPHTAPDEEASISDENSAPTDDASPTDGLPSGPDTTRAEETGMPVAHGVSANPLDALLQVVAQQQQEGSGVRIASTDPQTGHVVYA